MVYTIKYIPAQWGSNMSAQIAKIFMNGRSQAVRLPKSYRFEGKEVYLKKVPEGVLLLPKDKTIWEAWERNLQKYDSPFMVERNQPELQQQREGLDDVFD